MIPTAITSQHHFQERLLSTESCTIAMTGTVIKHSNHDRKAWYAYIECVLKYREDWTDGYKACANQMLPDT